MARDILFRGISEKTKQWVFGGISSNCTKVHGFKVIPDSVGQFTGLTDKNGVKVFEGDIVENHTTRTVFNADIRKYESISNTTRFCVVFDYNWGCFKFTEESERGVFTVIGNIFEPPELIGVQNAKTTSRT